MPEQERPKTKLEIFKEKLRVLKVLSFNEDAVKSLKSIDSWEIAIVALLISVAFQSLPINRQEVLLFPNTFQFFLVKYVVMMLLIFMLAKLFGAAIKLRTFIAATSIVYTFAMIVTIIAAYISIILFEIALKISVVSGFVISLIPFYTSVLFGWSSEIISGTKGRIRPVIIGLIAITLLFLYINYIDIVLCQLGATNAFNVTSILCG